MRAILVPALLSVGAALAPQQASELVDALGASWGSSAQEAVILDEQGHQNAALNATSESSAQEAAILDEQAALSATSESSAQEAVILDEQGHQNAAFNATSESSAQEAVILDEQAALSATSESSAQESVILDEQAAISATSESSAQESVILDEQAALSATSESSAQEAVILDEQATLSATSESSAQEAVILDEQSHQNAALSASSESSAQQTAMSSSGSALSTDMTGRIAAVVHEQYREIDMLNASVELRIAQMQQDWKLKINQLEEKLWQVQQEKRDAVAAAAANEDKMQRRLTLLEHKLAKMELGTQPSLERRLTQVEEAAKAEAQRRAEQEKAEAQLRAEREPAEQEFSDQSRSRESFEESQLILEESRAMGDLRAAHSALDRVALPLMAKEKVYQGRRKEIEAETSSRLLEEAEGLCAADGDRLDKDQLREILGVPGSKLDHLAAEVAQVAASATAVGEGNHTGLRWQDRLEGFRQKSALQSAHMVESIVHKVDMLADTQDDYDDRSFLEMLARLLNDTRNETQRIHEDNALIQKRLQENYGKYNTEYLSITLLQAINAVTENWEFKNHFLHMDTHALSHTTPGEEMGQACREMERIFASHILPFSHGVGRMRGALGNLTKVVPSILSTAGQKRALAMMQNRTKGILSMAYAQQIALKGVSNAIMNGAIPVLIERLHCNFTDPSSSTRTTSSPRTLISRFWSHRQ